jgi:hypothetical protein
MSKLAAVLSLALAGICLHTGILAGQVTFSPSILNSNAASVARVAGSQSAPQLREGPKHLGKIGIAQQAMPLSLPAEFASAPQSRALGAVAEPDSIIEIGQGIYSTRAATKFGSVGVNAVADTHLLVTKAVPTALQLSGTRAAGALVIRSPETR